MIFVGQYIAVEELGCFYQSVKSFSEGDQIVIVGGRLQSFVGSSYTANDEDFGIINRRRCQIYVAAFGGEDVVASSLVVYEGIQQSCDIKLNMNHWKAACIDKWPSDISKIGIFFRCVARCNDFLRNNPTLENSIFLIFVRNFRVDHAPKVPYFYRETFSDVELCGCTTLGEIGCCVPKSPLVDSSLSEKNVDYDLAFSIVFAIIGFRKANY
ncbi:unnamed protein product [Dracunculus medinensis]|uniref:ZP domain-containing protein n=1 Tax=Dracunculus medinensis TaxID=318479 RepID=A0A0N4U8L8_DRAME|nr:unnamed protein product [Dracunculus medinensis]